MTYADYFKAEAPTWHVFTDSEIELGDLPKEEEKAGGQKNDREAAKAARLAARQNKNKKEADTKNDPSAHLFGDRELNRSQGDPELRFTKKFTQVDAIDASLAGQEVIVRARLHNSRGAGKLTFIVMRQQFSTIQMTVAASETISKGMVNFSSKVPKESIIEVKATVVVPEKPVDSCTQSVELSVNEFWVINRSAPMLPF